MPYTWPGHKYLGPGNSLSGEPPVDADDRIALYHDIEYSLAQSSTQIRSSDIDAILNFADDYASNGNWHSLVGAFGLLTKYGLETIAGKTFYPHMAPPTHAGQEAYKQRMQAIKHSRATDTPARRRLPFGEYMRNWHAEQRDRAADQSATNEAAAHDHNYSSPDKQQAGPSGVSSSVQHQSAEYPSPDSSNRERSQLQPPPDATPSFESMFEDMDMLQDISSGAAAAGRDGSIGNSGTASSSALIKLYKPMPVASNRIKFTKTWIFYSYGYAFSTIDLNATLNGCCTPLSYLPVDMLSFYMSPTEHDSLPAITFAKNCKVSVKLLGVRTAFDTGATLSGVANTEHTHLAAFGIGLNTMGRAGNFVLKSDAAAPMKPTSFAPVVIAKDYNERFYGSTDLTNQPMTYGIPRANPAYLVYAYPKHQFTNGPLILNKHLNRLHVGSHIGKTIINYKYEFKHAPIKQSKFTDILTNIDHTLLSNNTSIPTEIITRQVKEGLVAIANQLPNVSKMTGNQYVCARQFLYNEPIEKVGTTMKPGHAAQFTSAQPLIHVGLFPTPKLNPGTELVDFQNSSIYYEVVSELEVECNFDSVYNYGGQHAAQGESVFYPIGQYNEDMHHNTTFKLVNHIPTVVTRNDKKLSTVDKCSDETLPPMIRRKKRINEQNINNMEQLILEDSSNSSHNEFEFIQPTTSVNNKQRKQSTSTIKK